MANAPLTHQALAELVGGTLIQGDAEGLVTGLNSLLEAQPGDVSFLGNSRYVPQLKTTKATVVLVAADLAEVPAGKALIQVANPTLAFSQAIKFFGPQPRPVVMGVHPTAVIGNGVSFDAGKVHVGPHVVIEDEAVIGDGCVIQAGSFIGYRAKLGEGCVIHPGVAIKEYCVLGCRVIIHSGSVIGTDGFGYEFVKGRHQKIEQIGIVQIDDDVEVGSCSTIDRARFGKTHIGAGTKIDNLVQIGHNVSTGQHCIIVALTGIAGSVRLGSYVVIAAQSGIAGHLEIASQVTLLSRSGVTKSIATPGGAYTGFPAKPLAEGRKLLAYPRRVPDLLERVKALEEKLARLEGNLPAE